MQLTSSNNNVYLLTRDVFKELYVNEYSELENDKLVVSERYYISDVFSEYAEVAYTEASTYSYIVVYEAIPPNTANITIIAKHSGVSYNFKTTDNVYKDWDYTATYEQPFMYAWARGNSLYVQWLHNYISTSEM